MLLRFRVINHKSIRDEAELSLVAPAMKTQAPVDGRNWAGATSRVAAIYGANASGKSTLLDALRFLRSAVVHSATSWNEPERKFPYRPFQLDEESTQRPSLYEVDFVANDLRYLYGFEAQEGKIEGEWLYSYPTRKRRLLFERGPDLAETVFGRSVGGLSSTLTKLASPSTLILSHGHRLKHELLSTVRNELVQGLQFAEISRDGNASRVRTLRRNLIEDKELKEHVEALIRMADLGIVSINIVERELSAEEVDKFSAFYESITESITKLAGRGVRTVEEMLEEARFSVTLEHESSGLGKTRTFHLHEESDGTVAWLALVVPALHALRHGETLLIDEVGANLHPVLTKELIRIFKDTDLNPTGGQLVFTTHDTPLMGTLLGNTLARDEVWFTEKAPDGGTSLYSLEEFSVRSKTNFEKRYLEGRFGAVPQIQDDELRSMLLDTGV